MNPGSIFLLLLCLTQFLFVLPSNAQDPISLTLSKSHHSSKTKHLNPKLLAVSNLQRAYHKYAKQQPSASYSSYPLFPISSGSYTFSLLLGTPPQKIPVTLDTGSSLVWVPCTSNYSCTSCTTSSNTTITTFKPKLSSTKTHVTCLNEKCKWLQKSVFFSTCFNCDRSIAHGNCSRPCNYNATYGGGASSEGQASTDDLSFPNNDKLVVHDFFFGCSHSTDSRLEGIAGFGRSPASLPNQLKVNKFSYCFVSHKYDNIANKSSSLILGNSGEVPGIKYTPLLQSPPILPYNNYYYVYVDAITVNNKHIKIPSHGIQVPDAKGNGGSIVDSGTALTIMFPALFNELVKEFLAQSSPAQRKKIQFVGPLLCVDVTGERRVSLPEVAFHFKGGATMDVPVANYYNPVPGSSILCLPFGNGTSNTGPAVIIGNYQQQNFHIEFNLKNERLGLKKQICG